MAKQKAKTATPRLRFPEFRGAWVEKLLKKICDVNPSSSGLPDSFFYIDLESVEEGVLKSKNSIEKASAPSRAQRLLRKGDVLFQTVRPYQRNNLHFKSDNAKPHVASTGYAQLRAKDSASFLYQLVHTDSFVDKVLAKCTGSNYPAINSTDLADVTCFAPEDAAEQQKIADCLTSLDEVIAAQGRKVEALNAHKCGLMQQLFPREGETGPRLRFPEFRNAPEWKRIPLGEIAEIKLGKMLDSNKQESGRLLPYVNNISLRWNEVDTSDLPQMYFKESELERYGLREGDVLVCEGGEPGRSAVWDGRLPNLKFQKAIHRVRFHEPFVPKLLVLYLEAIAGSNAFESLFTGGGIKHLTGETFAKLAVPVMSLAEQQRIADCLSSLDTRISAETARLAALKIHKQGLMQQLFPAPEVQGA